ncbi:uncharacterized protein LOC126736677 [Anthonomus grandis grandis]|uniref:uncharacterized protein LOC126736677 n=1 Tax=Anthonomus grandis grandis TaxID=2921223 RepID=UPI002166A831|nr:uncharacterized protein LOC126736677 [Anthonomus grandis grandis]
MVTQKPTVSQFFTFGPMFFTSFHVLCSVCPVVFQRYHYKQIYRVYMNLWPLKVADQQGLKEIKYLFIKGSCSVIFYALMASIISIAYLPLRGLDFDRSIWPAIAALKLLKDGPQSLIYAVIFMNYGLVFAKAYYLAIYGMHLMHMCTLYAIQNILLRRRIDCINNDNEDISPLVLIDDRKYQERVKRELKECIKLDIKLKRFSTSLIDYFKWVMIMHVGNAIIILSMLYYVNLFMNGGYDPLSTRCYVLGANLMAVCYAHYSEIYFEQTDLNRNALLKTPWYTFNNSNRKLMLIYLSNLSRPQYISAGGLLDVNYSLLIVVMHKCFNILTILKTMSPEGI